MRKGRAQNAYVLFEPCGVISDEIARFELGSFSSFQFSLLGWTSFSLNFQW